MSDFLVSIIETIADAAANAKARRAESLAAMRPAQAPQALVQRVTAAPGPQPEPVEIAAGPRPARAPVPERSIAAPPPASDRGLSLLRMFAGPDDLVRTVVAAEVIGPPAALRRQNLWDTPGV
jgi:hypothetical protein